MHFDVELGRILNISRHPNCELGRLEDTIRLVRGCLRHRPPIDIKDFVIRFFETWPTLSPPLITCHALGTQYDPVVTSAFGECT